MASGYPVKPACKKMAAYLKDAFVVKGDDVFWTTNRPMSHFKNKKSYLAWHSKYAGKKVGRIYQRFTTPRVTFWYKGEQLNRSVTWIKNAVLDIKEEPKPKAEVIDNATTAIEKRRPVSIDSGFNKAFSLMSKNLVA